MAQASTEKLGTNWACGKKRFQHHKVSSREVCQIRLSRKKTEQSHPSTSRDREEGESRDEQEPHLGEKEERQSESVKE